MAGDSGHPPDLLQQVLDFHQASKHSFEGYARGPGILDWATQPNPFRRYAGARLQALEEVPPTDHLLYDGSLEAGAVSPVAVARPSISQLFFDSLAISAWKSAGGAGWALRVNPSSGNLHPTEAYLICGPIDGLCGRPMVSHYAPREHGLEVRAEFEPVLWEGLAEGLPPASLASQ